MISVIIPCFNSKDFITRAVNSILKQTYTNYEIILVDNNSTDDTYKILQNYMKEYPELITVYSEYKKGAPAARNKGLHEAKGDWLQFLDSDDELLPDKLEKQIEIAENSEADIIVGGCYMHTTVKDKTEVKQRGIDTENVWKGLLTSNLGSTSSNLWRRKAMLAAGGWNEAKTSSQEYDLMFRMLKRNDKVIYFLTPQTIVHVRENSIHKSGDDNRLIEILDNNVNLRLQIKEYLQSASMITEELNYTIDTYIYRYLVNTSGWNPLSVKKGVVPTYVKKKLQQSNLNLPAGFIIKFHLNRIKNKIKRKILK